jgi:hypothetical protein
MSENNGNGNSVKWTALTRIGTIVIIVLGFAFSTGIVVGKVNALKEQTDTNTGTLNKQGADIAALQTAAAVTAKAVDDLAKNQDTGMHRR